MLVALAGLPGSGKSYLAKEVVRRNPHYVLFNKDEVREQLFPGKLTDFSSEQNDFCMDVIYRAAAYLLSKDAGKVIFIDGRTFSSKIQVDAVIAAAEGIGTECRFIKCVCSDETSRVRIMKDQDAHLAKNRDMDLYISLKQKADPLDIDHLTLKTDDPDLLDERVAKVIAFIESEGQEARP